MKGERVFFDTNVLVYAITAGDPRCEIAAELLGRGGVTGVQNLNEFAAVAARHLDMGWDDIREALREFRVLCPSPAPITEQTHDRAVEIVSQFRYHIYDALVIAAAEVASCHILYSEDFQDGQHIGAIMIRNPFRSA